MNTSHQLGGTGVGYLKIIVEAISFLWSYCSLIKTHQKATFADKDQTVLP